MSNGYTVSNEHTECSEEESIEIPGLSGVRKSKLVSAGHTIKFYIQDAETIWQVLQRGCRLYGNNRCLGWRTGKSDYSWITYKEFMERSQNFGSGLCNIGMNSGQSSIVGILGKNSIQWTIAEFGCFSQSAVVVPLNHTLGPEGCMDLLKQSDVQILICEEESKLRQILLLKEDIPSLKHIICMHGLSNETKQLRIESRYQFHSFKYIEELGQINPVPISPPSSTDVCIICFTSGTTGNPKGAELTHGNVVSSISSVLYTLGENGFTEKDSMISYLPMAHIFEHMVEMLMLLVGGSFGYYRGDVNLLVDDMKVLQPTFLPAAPRLLNKLYDKAQRIFAPKSKEDIILDENNHGSMKENVTSEKEDYSVYKPFLNVLGGKIRIIISGSAPLSESVMDFYRFGLGCMIMNAYGQTECCASHVNIVTEITRGNVGGPLPCCVMKLVDVPELDYYAKDGYGEVCIKGHNVFKGYLKDQTKTLQTLDAHGWLHTGDIGTYLPNGCLKIVDRQRNIFKISLGEYIAPEKIENIYLKSLYVSHVVVYGDSMKDYLVAIVVPEEEMVKEWTKENMKCETWTEMCKNRVLKEFILEDMRRLGKADGLHSYEQVKNIHLHPKNLSFEDGFVTNTMKLKRDFCKQFFKDHIEAMYNAVDHLKQ